MKGKGKTSHLDKECPLAFPDLQPVDHTKDCIKYSNILSRSEDESLTIDELDTAQTDLETLLASAGKRLKLLESEIQILVNWQDKKDVSNKKSTPGKESSGKRGKGGVEEKPSKKFKDANGKAAHVIPTPPIKPKNKSAQSKLQEYEFSDSPRETLPKLPKNDAVNRFWLSVEPYCGDISNDDLKLLEDILKSHEEDTDYFKVTPLGTHYTDKWAEEDLLEEQTDGVKMDKKRNSGTHNNNNNHHDSTTLLKKLETNCLHFSNMDESPFGQLTQRLVSALIEENIMTPIDDTMNDITGGKESADEAPAISPRTLAKQLNIGNPTHLERRIKRELEEQGILDFEDKEDDNPDDEILAEIRKKQTELRVLCQRNIIITRQLYCKAKEQMARQEMKKKLATADAEVMDSYRKIQATKQKKKTPTKKEKDSALKALKERESIMKALEV